MPLLTVSSVKGRPGVTTTALGLAAVLPASASPVVVECDPAGGDLAARHGLTVSPGLVELATATRAPASDAASVRADVLSRCAQAVSVADRVVQVVVAPSGGAQTRIALSVLTRPGQSALTPADRVVIADCGRLDFSSPAWPLLRVADAVLVLVCGRVDEVAHLRERIGELVRVAGDRLVVVLAGGVYGPAEVAAVLTEAAFGPVPVRGPLPTDSRAAAVLSAEQPAGRRWWRSPLPAALAQLTTGLPVRLDPAAGSVVRGNDGVSV